jgi:hypothetical protein
MKSSIFDDLYDVIFQPFAAMNRIAVNRQLSHSFLVALISICIPVVASMLGVSGRTNLHFVGVIVLLAVVTGFILWAGGAAVWNLIAELLGGRGSAYGLFCALGYAFVPAAAFVPCWVLAAVMPAPVTGLLLGIALLAAWAWTILLIIAAVKGAHGISTSRSILVLLVPALIGVVILFMFGTFLSAEILQIPASL